MSRFNPNNRFESIGSTSLADMAQLRLERGVMTKDREKVIRLFLQWEADRKQSEYVVDLRRNGLKR